jgi:hypothetical protein
MKRFLVAILLTLPLLVAQNAQNVGTIPLASQSTIQGLAGTTSVVSYTIFGNAQTQGVPSYGVLAQGLLTTANAILYTAPPDTTAFISLITLANTSASAVSGVTLAINGSAATATYQVMPGVTIGANGFATLNSQAWEVHDVTGNAISGGGSVTASGTPTIHQLPVWTTATDVKGVTIPNNDIVAGNTSADPSGKSLGDLEHTLYVVGGGIAQAQTVTLAPAATALTAGLTVRWLPVAANSGAAPTLAVNGLTATAITKCGATALVASDLTTTAVAVATYDGTQFQLLNPQAGPCVSGIIAAANGGTGVANSVTLTLGSAAQNWGTLGTGIVKNTTSTGAITDATAHDLVGPLACAGSGTGTAQTCTTSPTFVPAAGDSILLTASTPNTGDVTVNANSSSPYHVRKWQGASVLAANDLLAIPVALTFDGTYWEIQAVGNAPALSGAATTPNGQTCALGSTCNVNNGATQHSVAINGAAAAAIGGVGPGTTNQLLAAVTSSDPTLKSLSDLNSTEYAVGSGSVTAMTVTLAPPATAYTAGLTVRMLSGYANSGADPTLAVNSIAGGPKTIKKCGTTALVQNDINTAAVAVLTYDGTNFQLLNPQVGGCETSLNGTSIPSTATLAKTIDSGALALAVSQISANACQAVTPGSVNSVGSANVVATDVIEFTPNVTIKGVTGYRPGDTLTIVAFPTTGYVNFDVCNKDQSSAVTPGAVTLNWRVTR